MREKFLYLISSGHRSQREEVATERVETERVSAFQTERVETERVSAFQIERVETERVESERVRERQSF